MFNMLNAGTANYKTGDDRYIGGIVMPNYLVFLEIVFYYPDSIDLLPFALL